LQQKVVKQERDEKLNGVWWKKADGKQTARNETVIEIMVRSERNKEGKDRGIM
jgi:hypothetical protein